MYQTFASFFRGNFTKTNSQLFLVKLKAVKLECKQTVVFQVEAMQQAGGEQAAQAEEMLKDQDKLVEEIFSHEDKDKDGYISHDEFSGPKHDEL